MRKRLLISIFVLLTFIFSCNKDKAAASPSDGELRSLRSHELDLSSLKLESFDMNADKKDDQFKYYDIEGNLLVIARDINFDSQIDVYEFYENSILIREESDLDFDGKLDLVVHYKDGKLETKEYSIDFHGNRHGRQTYDKDGNLILSERDTNGDGVYDLWEHFLPGASEPHLVKKDSDGDGVPDSD